MISLSATKRRTFEVIHLLLKEDFFFLNDMQAFSERILKMSYFSSLLNKSYLSHVNPNSLLIIS